MVMIRKQIYLSAQTDRRLKREAKLRGIAEAAVIRERLDHACEHAPAIPAPDVDPEARDRFIQMLRDVREKAGWGPGTGWKFDRDEVYAERSEKARPVRHERPRQRRRSS